MLKQAHYWLLLQISKTPRTFIYGAGVLVAVLLIILSAITVFFVDQARTAERHSLAMGHAYTLVNESADLLNQLVSSNNTDCASNHLIRLNALLLQTRFIREIGILDAQGMLLAGMLISSLLIAALVGGTLTPYVLRLQGIHNRVRFLCDEAHILLSYQPIFDLVSLRPIGCEVLMRLKEGNHIWMPEHIIPAVLRAGLAHSFDRAVSTKAIRELSSHLPVQQGTFKIALNFFPESIHQATLAPMLQDALSDHPRDDIQICIEVTEHSLSSNLIAEGIENLDQVKLLAAMGVRYGQGYALARPMEPGRFLAFMDAARS